MASHTRLIVCCASILGVTGVILGAFGAHALKEHLLAVNRLEAWETATLYHLLHAVALLGLGAVSHSGRLPLLKAVCWCWVLGVVLFSGSIYGLALTGLKVLGPITPIGGLFLITGWALLGISAFKATSD